MNMVKQHSCIPTKLLFRNNLFILLEQFPHVAGSNLLHCYQIFFLNPLLLKLYFHISVTLKITFY